MDSGYIKLWRKIDKWGWRSNSKTFSFFMYLLTKASYTNSEFLGMPIKPGQAIIGLHQTSLDIGLSVQSIRTAIGHLKSTNEITVKSTNRFSIVTILNYSSYQSQEEIDNIQNNKKLNTPSTNHQQTTNNIQEVKKLRNKEYKEVDFIPELKKIYEPMGVSVDTELSKMRGWLLTKPNRKLTKQFAVKWLNNNIERNKEIKTEQSKPKAFPSEYLK